MSEALHNLYAITGDPNSRGCTALRTDGISSLQTCCRVLLGADCFGPILREGGSAGGEHWGEPGKLSRTLTTRTCESCVTHNMLQVTDRLFRWTANPMYADFYEQALGSNSRHFFGESGLFSFDPA